MPSGSPVGTAALCSPLPTGLRRRRVAPSVQFPSSLTVPWSRSSWRATLGPTAALQPIAPTSSHLQVRTVALPGTRAVPAGSRHEALRVNVTQGFVATPSSLFLILQAAMRRQSCVPEPPRVSATGTTCLWGMPKGLQPCCCPLCFRAPRLCCRSPADGRAGGAAEGRAPRHPAHRPAPDPALRDQAGQGGVPRNEGQTQYG